MTFIISEAWLAALRTAARTKNALCYLPRAICSRFTFSAHFLTPYHPAFDSMKRQALSCVFDQAFETYMHTFCLDLYHDYREVEQSNMCSNAHVLR